MRGVLYLELLLRDVLNLMRQKSIELFLVGLACFCLGLVVCIILKPLGLSVNSGISYYGNYKLTLVPYLLSVVGYGFFNLLLAVYIADQDLWPLKYSLYIFAFLCLVIGITPYSVGPLLNDIHTTAGTILFALQLILSGWLIIKMRYKIWPIIFSGVELIAGIVAAFYVHGPHGFLIQAQIVFQLSFAALLYLALKELVHHKHSILT